MWRHYSKYTLRCEDIIASILPCVETLFQVYSQVWRHYSKYVYSHVWRHYSKYTPRSEDIIASILPGVKTLKQVYSKVWRHYSKYTLKYGDIIAGLLTPRCVKITTKNQDVAYYWPNYWILLTFIRKENWSIYIFTYKMININIYISCLEYNNISIV